MAGIQVTNIIQGAGPAHLPNPGIPSAGTSEVQTLTIGGTPTGGSFTLNFRGQVVTIPWSATNATLLASINSGLQGLSAIGSTGVTATAGSLTAGIGTILLTFGGNLAALNVTDIVADGSGLTGASPTVAVAETTPGVRATLRGLPTGSLVMDTTNNIAYQSTGTPAPTFSKVGPQT